MGCTVEHVRELQHLRELRVVIRVWGVSGILIYLLYTL